MTHIFIINPKAGRGNARQWLEARISAAFADAPALCEVYVTQRPGDATEFVVRRCKARQGEELFCFYGCGGDGTLNEVATGLLDYPFACMGVVPCGTGNDFIKNFPDRNFLNLAAQRQGSPTALDLISCNGRIAVNICNAGLDANVARDITLFKRLPLFGGPMAYVTSLCKNFFGKLGQPGAVCCDGVADPARELLLLVVANGCFYGGSFRGAPEARLDDGLMDVVVVPKISHLKILSVLPRYQKGRHTTDSDLQALVTYRKCRKIRVEYTRPVTLCMDGETMETNLIDAAILPGALRVWLPGVMQESAPAPAAAKEAIHS